MVPMPMRRRWRRTMSSNMLSVSTVWRKSCIIMRKASGVMPYSIASCILAAIASVAKQTAQESALLCSRRS